MPWRFILKDYVLIWLALVLAGLSCRPLIPVDETRAVSVAWEMWQRGDFLVPYLNGQPYSHKPPLLQWCIHSLWWVFGVSEWSARLVAPLFALGNLALTAKLARRLWPDDTSSDKLAPLLLLANPMWALWTSLTLYDMMVTFFTLLGLHGILRAARGKSLSGWALTALAIAGGVLSKGPAILLMILPPALSAPWWLNSKPTGHWRGWYGPMLGAVLLGTLSALAWAVPAGLAGGEEYREAIFWGQSVGRISNSFAHKLPFWWYFAWLPILCLPWTLWPPLWRSVQGLTLDTGLRFCAAQGLSVLLVFSLISGKRIHYLLPILPTLALFAARGLSLARPSLSRRDQMLTGLLLMVSALALFLLSLGLEASHNKVLEIIGKTPLAAKLALFGLGVAVLAWPAATLKTGVRLLALTMLGFMFIAHLVYRQEGWPYHDMQPFADRLAAVERQGAPIVHWQEYHGDFNFLGRLEHPPVEFHQKQELLAWVDAHPGGYVILLRQPDAAANEEGAEFAQYYRGGRRIMLWQSAKLLARSGNLERMLTPGN